MPYKDPAARRANYYKNRERNLARQRASYAKHRDKRLAAKRAEYEADPEKMRQRNAANYAKHRAARVEFARAYRAERLEELAAQALERYYANLDAIKERRRELRQRPEARAKAYESMKDWLQRNPEKALIQHAKRLLSESTGMRIRDIPNDLAEAKAAQILVLRFGRDGDVNALAPIEAVRPRRETGSVAQATKAGSRLQNTSEDNPHA